MVDIMWPVWTVRVTHGLLPLSKSPVLRQIVERQTMT